jgi:hypothetical protein
MMVEGDVDSHATQNCERETEIITIILSVNMDIETILYK